MVLTKSVIDLFKSEQKYKELKFIDGKFVDLDLPSGTLWATKNIGATCGKSAKSWYGNYYAWGETEPRKGFFKNEYDYDKYENYKELPQNKDAAYLAWNNKHCSMPTKYQIEELIDYTNCKYVQNYNQINDLDGYIFTSRLDKNKFIFMPSSGTFYGDELFDISIISTVWAKTGCLPNDIDHIAYILQCDVDPYIETSSKYLGYPIRPVYNKNKI